MFRSNPQHHGWLVVPALPLLVTLHGACGGDADVTTSGAGGASASSASSGAGGSTSSGAGGTCPTDTFLDVSKFAGAGANYPKPTLAVSCSDAEVLVKSNGIIHYEFNATTPNDLKAQDLNWHFPRTPKALAKSVEIPLLGAAGVAVNGMPFYGPNEAAMPDPYGDPVYNGIMDECLGHTGPSGDYHYHALLVKCLTQSLSDVKPSPIVAYAFDGYPVYGPYECSDASCTETVELLSSWTKKGDPKTYAWDNNECTKATCETPSGVYLDRCNGHVGPKGDYHYHATSPKKDATYTGFPYILGCYHGEATNNGGTGGTTTTSTGAGMMAGSTGAGGGMAPMCTMPGQMMCCGDGFCGGPESHANCPADCK